MKLHLSAVLTYLTAYFIDEGHMLVSHFSIKNVNIAPSLNVLFNSAR